MRIYSIPRLITLMLWGLCIFSVFLFLSVFFESFAPLQTLQWVRIDSLSTLILLMVTFLGAVVGHYSLRYLDGEENIDSFFRKLAFTILAVSTLVVSSNLIMFFMSWFAMSMGLHGLLLFYPERPLAVLAARKKFIISRIGDLFLIIAIVLVHNAFGTFNFEQIFNKCLGVLTQAQTTQVSWSGFFFVAGAMTKSAQIPFHFWLPETMETPTPVSALMHAGIINAGGFLILRLSPIMTHAPFANLMLAFIGALTAIMGSLVMVTQNDIKKKLAYSTISQMGLMMFACGIGAYNFALFHIVSHSLYKAYAFLSTGDLVEENKKLSVSLESFCATPMIALIGLGLAIVITGFVYHGGTALPEFTYVSVLFLGLSQNAESLEPYTNRKWSAWTKIAAKIACAILIFIILESALRFHVETLLSLHRDQLNLSSPLFVVCLVSYFIFATGFWLGNTLMNPVSRFSKTLYFMMWNGGYFGVRSTTLLKTLWPVSGK